MHIQRVDECSVQFSPVDALTDKLALNLQSMLCSFEPVASDKMYRHLRSIKVSATVDLDKLKPHIS